ncbi:MAG: zinc-dependent metalloprotease, partial [Burkholderiales bacterium]
RAVEDWQSAFEAAGFKHAIVARDAPSAQEDPDWDPEDARYSVIRWVPSTRQKALGPSLVDPRSGEVVSSHIVLWHDVLRLVETWYFTHAAALDPRAANLPLDDDLMGELLRYVVSHELGHTLGLRHNFKAASAYSVEQLRDPAWTKKWGTSASIMSYARINYVAQPGDGAALLPRFGPYDFFAIHWGYHPLPGMTGEWAELDRLAARQTEEPMLRFGGEDEAADIDPSVTTHVLGSDPVVAADLGLRNVDRTMELLVPASTRLGRDYTRLGELYEALVTHRHRQLEAVARLVGGVEETRHQAGRGGAPFAPVDPIRARAAVRFIAERAFAKPGPLLDRGVLRRVSPEGWLDPLQGSNIKLLERLLDPAVFQRLAEATTWASPYSGYMKTPPPYQGSDLLRDLSEHLFEELGQPRVEIGFYRRELQRNYIHLLVSDKESEPEGRRMPSKDAWPGIPSRDAMVPLPAFNSELAEASKELRSAKDRPSEFRSAARGAALDLSKRIEAAIPKARDRVTALHLSDLHKRLMRDR